MGEYSIRPLEERDLQMLLNWRNSERIHSKMLTEHKITWDEHYTWFQKMKENPVKRNLIFEFQGRAVGYIGYTEYDEQRKSCSPGAYLGETDVPIDAGITLFYMAVEYAFSELKMQRLETSVFRSNKQAMRLDLFLGYREISDSDEVIMKNGKAEIAVRMALSRAVWEVRKKEIVL